MGNVERARVYASGTLAPAERLRHNYWMTVALWTKAGISRVEGDWVSTRNFVKQGFIVDPQEMTFISMRALLEAEVGDFSLAGTHLEKMLDILRPRVGLGASPQVAMVVPMVPVSLE